jgi:basic amino acid/polyamine antiporter, APA family
MTPESNKTKKVSLNVVVTQPEGGEEELAANEPKKLHESPRTRDLIWVSCTPGVLSKTPSPLHSAGALHKKQMQDSPSSTQTGPRLVRRLGLFDATMIVMGGIIGSGIFINPYVVARQLHSPFLILGVWGLGGLIALAAAFIWAELAALRPEVGGQYAYLREAFHPSVAFLYGWALLLVIQTGGMAAVAVTFARYFVELTHLPITDSLVAVLALASLTIINCLGVRSGSTVQSVLMVLKIVAIIALIACGLLIAGRPATPATQAMDLVVQPTSFDLITAVGAAMVPVLFAYGGWQTASFVAGEIREPKKNLPRGLIIGVTGVVVLYLAVNFVYLRVLGTSGLAATTTPASDVMRLALGEKGARAIAAGIAISTLGFLSQGMLTAPRVYFAMAEDGLFFKAVGRLHPTSRVPIVAIALQGLLAIIIGLSGQYEQILNYVVSVDFIFFGLTALCIFVFRRRRENGAGLEASAITRVPGHPLTTGLFVVICWLVVINTVYKYPENTLIGLGILIAGIPAYFFWRGR